jgi:DNA-binding NarL/FixJ family response regulator
MSIENPREKFPRIKQVYLARHGLFTPRREEIVMLIAQGLSNAEIAARLCIAHMTVRNHVSGIFRSIEVMFGKRPDRSEMLIILFERGILDLRPISTISKSKGVDTPS